MNNAIKLYTLLQNFTPKFYKLQTVLDYGPKGANLERGAAN